MSLSLVNSWVENMIRFPATRTEARTHFEQASIKGVDATVIVGTQLTTTGQCYLARWDRRDLVVLGIETANLVGWEIAPNQLCRQAHFSESPFGDLTDEPQVSLSQVQFDRPMHDGKSPLAGICKFEFDGPPHQFFEKPALRIRYFHPGMNCEVSGMCYTTPVRSPAGEFTFQFSPLFSADNPAPQGVRGMLVVYLQMYAADDWRTMSGCQKLSAPAVAFVTLR